MIIDAHTHIFDEESYAGYMSKSRDKAVKMLTLHFWTNEGQSKHSLNNVLRFAQTKDNLFVVAAVNIFHDIDKQLKELERLFDERRIVGIKMYPGYQPFSPFEKIVHPVAALCQKYGKPLMFHSGDMSPRGKPLLKYALPIHIDELAVRYPECRIVITHFGFPYFLEAAVVANKNKNVFLDISGTLVKTNTEDESTAQQKVYAEDISRALAYFPDIRQKIMFGTDYGGEHSHLNQVEPYIKLVEQVFGEREQKRVFSGVAEELFFS